MIQSTTPLSELKVYKRIDSSIPPLYHYANQGTLIGVTKYKHLWFTNIKYMNDSSEYDEALEFIFKVLKEEYEVNVSFNLEALPYISSAASSKIFSFSLTESKDLLSQWRGYCPNGGYSISFFSDENKASSQLSELVETYAYYIGKCVYDDASKKELIAKFMVGLTPAEYKIKYGGVDSISYEGYENTPIPPEVFAARRSNTRQAKAYKFIMEEVFNRIMLFAPLMKNFNFKEEIEWRIIASPPAGEVKFREGKSHIIPYIEIPLAKDGQMVDIPHVIVGPTPHKELAKQVCEMITGKEVTFSEIPYRNW